MKKHKHVAKPIDNPKGEPTKLKIGYRDITLEWMGPDFKTDELTDCYGQYKAKEGVIQIQDKLCGQEKINTLLHEAIHAIVYGSGLNQANGPLKEEDAEELAVNQISNYLLGMFRDNPWFLDYIKKHIYKDK
jgi:hypothetical protein